MGKCLSRAEKLGNNTSDLARQSVDQKVSTVSLSVGVASNQMGGSSSTGPVASAQLSGSPRMSGEAIDKANRQSALLSTAFSSTHPSDVSIELLSGEQVARDRRAIELFDRYRDPDADCILADGIERLCADMGVAPDDFSVLVLAWKFNAEAMCRFTREEFITGCRALGGVDSPKAIAAKLPDLVHDVSENREHFRDLYRWSYRFGLDVGQRTLPLSMAISLWNLVFSQGPPPILERWLAFLEQRPSGSSGMMRDTWDMFLLFTEVIGNDLDRYDESEAWPSLIDDFVEYENDRKNHNVAGNISSGDICHN